MAPPSTSEITQLLLAWSAGDQSALEKTALVNEAYLRLVNVRQVNVQNRAQFFGPSAWVMRNILVDFVRSRPRSADKREPLHVSLDDALTVSCERGPDLVALDEALDALTRNRFEPERSDPDQRSGTLSEGARGD